MLEWTEHAIRLAVLIGQYIFGAAAIYAILQLWPPRAARWKHLAAVLSWRTKQAPDGWLRLFRISRQRPSFHGAGAAARRLRSNGGRRMVCIRKKAYAARRYRVDYDCSCMA